MTITNKETNNYKNVNKKEINNFVYTVPFAKSDILLLYIYLIKSFNFNNNKLSFHICRTKKKLTRFFIFQTRIRNMHLINIGNSWTRRN